MKMLGTVCAALVAVSTVWAGDQSAKAPTKSPEFEKLKTLVGSWQGKVDMGNGEGPVDMVADYRLLAGGTVLEERVFAGTPNEMITMFFEKDGKLALTHYCVLGNRPGMVLKATEPNTFKFAFDESCGIDTAKESHMNALTLKLVDADTMTASCKAFIDGKEMPEKPSTFKRVAKK